MALYAMLIKHEIWSGCRVLADRLTKGWDQFASADNRSEAIMWEWTERRGVEVGVLTEYDAEVC